MVHKSMRLRYVAIAAAALLCLAAFATKTIWSVHEVPTFPRQVPGPTPSVAKVVARSITKEVVLTGILQSTVVVEVQAPFDGTIQARSFEWGEAAAEGSSLLTLSTDEIDKEIREASAAMLKSSAAAAHLRSWSTSLDVLRSQRGVANSEQLLVEGEKKLVETRRLLDLGIVPRVELEDLQTQQHQLNEQLVTAREELGAAKDRGGLGQMKGAELEMESAAVALKTLEAARMKRRITLPIAGTITVPPVNSNGAAGSALSVGTRVKRGDTLLRVQSTNDFELRVDADEAQVTAIKKGQAVKISMTASPSTVLEGEVAWVSALPSGDAGRSGELARYPVRITLRHLSPENLASLRPGMGAQANVQIYNHPEALTLPVAFVQKDGASAFVNVRGEGSHPFRMDVETGVVGADFIEVSERPTATAPFRMTGRDGINDHLPNPGQHVALRAGLEVLAPDRNGELVEEGGSSPVGRSHVDGAP